MSRNAGRQNERDKMRRNTARQNVESDRMSRVTE